MVERAWMVAMTRVSVLRDGWGLTAPLVSTQNSPQSNLKISVQYVSLYIQSQQMNGNGLVLIYSCWQIQRHKQSGAYLMFQKKSWHPCALSIQITIVIVYYAYSSSWINSLEQRENSLKVGCWQAAMAWTLTVYCLTMYWLCSVDPTCHLPVCAAHKTVNHACQLTTYFQVKHCRTCVRYYSTYIYLIYTQMHWQYYIILCIIILP